LASDPNLLALPGIDLGIVKAAGLLQHSSLVDAIKRRELGCARGEGGRFRHWS